jgi:hypothetical protein
MTRFIGINANEVTLDSRLPLTRILRSAALRSECDLSAGESGERRSLADPALPYAVMPIGKRAESSPARNSSSAATMHSSSDSLAGLRIAGIPAG